VRSALNAPCTAALGTTVFLCTFFPQIYVFRKGRKQLFMPVQNIRKVTVYYILKGSDDDVWHYRVFGLCPSSVILKCSEHNISETGSVSLFRTETV
jgi:hypothetical protein